MASRPPFEFVGPLLRSLLLWVGILLMVCGLRAVMTAQAPDLAACKTNGDCVDVAPSLGQPWARPAGEIGQGWPAAAKQRANDALRADSWLLVPGYVLVLSILCGAAARRGDQRSYRGGGIVMAWTAFVLGAVDLAENTLLGMALDGAAVRTAVDVASWAKWILLALVAGYACVAPLSRYAMGRH